MAKLPSGWIFIPHFKDLNHIELVERKLITCRECKHAHMTVNGECKWCDLEADSESGDVIERYRPGDWFCADGEANDDEP